MATNTLPQYVKLSDKVLGENGWTGILCDLDTGWSISGYDVQAVPDDEEVQRFIRDKIRAGVLDEATDTEHSVVREADDFMAQIRPVNQHVEEGSYWPENVFASHAREHHRKVRASRGAAASSEAPQEPQSAPEGGDAGSKAKKADGGS